MSTFSELMDQVRPDEQGRASAIIPASWMQGRTTYGGLSAALCLQAAMPLSGGRPIRSAQIAFVGPSGGPVEMRTEILREGKNTCFVTVRLTGEAGVAVEAIFAFGNPRTSELSLNSITPPDVLKIDQVEGMGEGGPAFLDNFDRKFADATDFFTPKPDMSMWLRHRDAAASGPVALLAIADAPPPAAIRLLTKPAPLSSMTWMAEFLVDSFPSTNDWVLTHHEAQTGKDGYSSQSMQMFDAAGQPLIVGRQTVAIFG